MNKILIFFITLFSTLKAEFLLVEKNNDYVKAISYSTLDDLDKSEVINHYKTMNRYSWPMVTMHYWNFSENERSTYDKALDEEKGIEHFIRNKIEEQSNGKYTIIYVPTPLFELSLAYWYYRKENLGKEENEAELYKYKINTGKNIKAAAENISFKEPERLNNYLKLIEQIFETVNSQEEVINSYFNAINAYFMLMTSDYKSMINNVFLELKDEVENRCLCVTPEMKPIVLKIITIEEDLVKNNKTFLLRGSSGTQKNGEFLLDLPLKNGIYSLSYANSLFAGTLKESGVIGARTIDYMLNKYGSFVTISIKDFLLSMKTNKGPFTFFYIPALSTTASFYGHGELFHPRIKGIGVENTLSGGFLRAEYSKYKNLLFNNIPYHQFAADLINYLTEHTHIFKTPKEDIEIEPMSHSTKNIQRRVAFGENRYQEKEDIKNEEDEEFQKLIKKFKERGPQNITS